MALAAAALFAVNGSVSKAILTTGLPPVRLVELRAAGAFVLLLAGIAAIAPGRLRVGVRELPFLVVYGIFGFALVQWLYFVSIDRLPVGIALLLQFTAPVFVALYARYVLHERVRSRVWAGIAVALVGLGVVVELWGGLSVDGVGVLAALAGAVSLTAYFVLGERGVARHDVVTLTCWGFLFAAVFWSALVPWWTFPWAELGKHAAVGDASVPVWSLALWMVVLGTVVPFLLVIGSLRHLPATRVGIVTMAEPVLATVVAWLWLGEALGPAQLVGGAIVLGAIALSQTAR
jgi:drug/metabolite transporter (DMT)-like permease